MAKHLGDRARTDYAPEGVGERNTPPKHRMPTSASASAHLSAPSFDDLVRGTGVMSFSDLDRRPYNPRHARKGRR